MRRDGLLAVLALVLAAAPTAMVGAWVRDAGARAEELRAETSAQPAAAIARAADEEYCNADLKRVLRRVLQSCGLLGAEGARGCQPLEARNVATMQGRDFNALFLPLSQRAAIIELDHDSAELDEADRRLVDETFGDQGGASYFLIVARASPDGQAEHNRDLSRRRAEAILAHLRERFHDPDLDKEVGLLWLGEEFAQLESSFCAWHRSGDPNQCDEKNLNRSAFIAWIDCRL